MPIVDSWGFGPMATVTGEVTGDIMGLERFNGSTWQTMEPTVNIGSDIGLRCTGYNTSSINVSAILAISFRDPMGQTIGQASTKSATLSPGSNFSHERKIKATIPGQYEAYVSLTFNY